MESKPEIKVSEGETKNFSKSIMGVIVFLYLIGAILGTVLVIIGAIMDLRMNTILDSQMFIAYAAYLGGPTATAIGFYAWKSKAENVLKIGKSFKVDPSQMVDVVSRMEEN